MFVQKSYMACGLPTLTVEASLGVNNTVNFGANWELPFEANDLSPWVTYEIGYTELESGKDVILQSNIPFNVTSFSNGTFINSCSGAEVFVRSVFTPQIPVNTTGPNATIAPLKCVKKTQKVELLPNATAVTDISVNYAYMPRMLIYVS